MKLCVQFLLLISLLFGQTSDCNGQTSSDCIETVEGYLQKFGTDHFSKLAVVSDEYGRLFLDLSSEKQDSLWAERGNRVQITGNIHKRRWSGKPQLHITPVDWEWIHDDVDKESKHN